jgi:response regulator RpfG family c-di-GMP phosphodiesterase
MKSRSAADQTRLRLLLAVKGRADNLDLLQPVKSFTEAGIELTNPRSIKDLQSALESPDYDLIICDYQLLNPHTIAQLGRIREESIQIPLIVFVHEADPDKFKQAQALQSLHTFVITELDTAGLRNLIQISLKHALLHGAQPSAASFPARPDFSRGYAYHATVNKDGYLHTDWVSDSFEAVTGYSTDEVKRAGGWVSLVDKEDLP